MRQKVVPFALTLVLSLCQANAQSVPTLVNYQGRFAGNTPQADPVTGTLPMEFKIYGSQSGSDLLWSETWPSVEVLEGTFSVLLGSNAPLSSGLFASASTRYLEIVVNGEVLSPRQTIASVPFAQVADRLDGYEGAALEESAEIVGSISAHDADDTSHPHLTSAVDALEGAQSKLASQLASHHHDDLYYTEEQMYQIIGQQVSVKTFGAVGDGVTDDSIAVLAAINSLSATGGVVFFPIGTYVVNSQIVFPNSGAPQDPRQPPYRLVGEGAHFDGRSGPPTGGTVLDLRYSTGPKIATYGLGLLEISGLTLADSMDDDAPFVYTTNTTLHIHDASFYGTRHGSSQNDAIILGGTAADGEEGGNGVNAPFQGYGTVIRDNYFGRIRRAVYGRVFANGVAVYGNTVWNNCGSPLPGGAAIELDGDPDSATPQVNAGWYVAGNLIEVMHYTYGIKARESERNAFIANNFFDPGANTLAYYRFESTGALNYVLAGYHDDNRPFVDDQTPAHLRNTVINFHQNQQSLFAEPITFGDTMIMDPAHAFPFGPIVRDLSGNELAYRFWHGNNVRWTYTPSGGSPVPLFEVAPGKVTASTGVQYLSGPGKPTMLAPNGSLYSQTDGTTGGTFYVRENGVWVAK